MDRCDAPPGHAGLDAAPQGLDFGEFGHGAMRDGRGIESGLPTGCRPRFVGPRNIT
jgi:hypothetical protein